MRVDRRFCVELFQINIFFYETEILGGDEERTIIIYLFDVLTNRPK